MNKFLFLLPYLLSLTITTGVFFYAWRHRQVRGAQAYAWYVAGQALWGLGFIFELISPALSGKIFWDKVQWIPLALIAVAFPVFAFQYTETKVRHARFWFSASLVIPLIFLGVLLTDSFQHLIYPDSYLDRTVIFSDLKYEFTWVVYAISIYSYGVMFTGLGILLRRLVRPHYLYRRQILIVAFGFFVPVGTTILTLAGVEFKPFRDVSPFSIALGNLIVAWGLFRYKLFSVVPIARDLIVDNMDDAVVVFDTQDRVVDINRTALETINKTSAQAIGQPAKVVFAAWPEIIRQFEQPTNSLTKIAVVTLGNQRHYEVKSTLLYDKQKRFVGRVYVARNVTEHILLENSLKTLNMELEERVAERTEELRESVEQFRELWDATVEGIVIHNQGKIIEVNDAICKMFDIQREDAIGKTLFDFISSDSHELIRERISSERSEPIELPVEWANGKGIVEAFPRPIIYQGKNLRVVAIRDITERKKAEKQLAEAYDTTLEGWAKALELRDKETEDHSRRVTKLTVTLAKAMGIDGDELTHIRRGAILHDIGKMGIPDEILLKPDTLTIDERRIVEQHPIHSYELLSQIPFLEKSLDIPYCHHERWDGNGYPRGLKGDEIPLAARIFTVVDIWDAVQSDRPYNRAWPKEKAIQYLIDETGKYFDPQVVKVFLGLVEQGKI